MASWHVDTTSVLPPPPTTDSFLINGGLRPTEVILLAVVLDVVPASVLAEAGSSLLSWKVKLCSTVQGMPVTRFGSNLER